MHGLHRAGLTGSIDNWRVVERPFTLAEQFGFAELPPQAEFSATASEADTSIEALDPEIAALLARAHGGGGGKAKAPASATKPTINLHTLLKPAEAIVQGNYRLTADGADNDVRHIILDFGGQTFPVLEGQSLGVIPPGPTPAGSRICPGSIRFRAPVTGSVPIVNNVSLTVKREHGVSAPTMSAT